MAVDLPEPSPLLPRTKLEPKYVPSIKARNTHRPDPAQRAGAALSQSQHETLYSGTPPVSSHCPIILTKDATPPPHAAHPRGIQTSRTFLDPTDLSSLVSLPFYTQNNTRSTASPQIQHPSHSTQPQQFNQPTHSRGRHNRWSHDHPLQSNTHATHTTVAP